MFFCIARSRKNGVLNSSLYTREPNTSSDFASLSHRPLRGRQENVAIVHGNVVHDVIVIPVFGFGASSASKIILSIGVKASVLYIFSVKKCLDLALGGKSGAADDIFAAAADVERCFHFFKSIMRLFSRDDEI